MKIQIDISPKKLPSLVRQVTDIVGWHVWKKRIQELESLSTSNALWPEFILERHSLEIAFGETIKYIKNTGGRCAWPPRTADEYRLYSFIAMVAQVYRKLGQNGKTRLSGALRNGLKQEYGLGPLAFEMKTATHLMARGFDVTFQDIENGGGHDFLAVSGETIFEVECKHVSADIGRKLHRRKLYNLAELLSPVLSQALEISHGGFHVRVTIPDRLNGNSEQHQLLTSEIQMALSSGTGSETPSCAISVEKFDIATSPFSLEPGANLTTYDIREKFCRDRGYESGHSLANWRPGKTAIVVCFNSRKADAVLSKILRNLKKDARRQFTGNHPAFMCIHLADITDEQLLNIAQTEQSGTVTGIKIALNELLKTRPYIHTVALTCDGTVTHQRGQTGNFRSTSTQEIAPSYLFRNAEHPQANEPILRDVFLPRGRVNRESMLK